MKQRITLAIMISISTLFIITSYANADSQIQDKIYDQWVYELDQSNITLYDTEYNFDIIEDDSIYKEATTIPIHSTIWLIGSAMLSMLTIRNTFR